MLDVKRCGGQGSPNQLNVIPLKKRELNLKYKLFQNRKLFLLVLIDLRFKPGTSIYYVIINVGEWI